MDTKTVKMLESSTENKRSSFHTIFSFLSYSYILVFKKKKKEERNKKISYIVQYSKGARILYTVGDREPYTSVVWQGYSILVVLSHTQQFFIRMYFILYQYHIKINITCMMLSYQNHNCCFWLFFVSYELALWTVKGNSNGEVK